VLAPRPLARALALGLALTLASPALAADVRLGWSLGAQQSFQTVLTDSAQAFALTQAVAGSTLSDTLVQRFTGLVLNTGVTANATIDVVGAQWEQGLLVGVALNQLVPTLLPEDAAPNTAPASTAFQANAVYLARLVRPTWTWSLGGGYAFGLNGQLPIGADGGTGAAAGTLPGAQVGPLVISGQTHTASARTLVQLTRARWDADLGFDYTFAANGIFTLAAAAGGGAGAAAGGAATSALGAFVPATSHTLAPQLQARRRISARDTLSASLRGSLVLPVEVELEDELVQNLLPQTANANLTAGFEHVLRDEHRWFVSLGGTLSLRRPSDLALGADGGVSGRALVDPATGDTYGLRTDTLIYTLEVGLQGRVRSLELGYRASAGVAQPRLYQPPLGGASARFPLYEDPVIGAIQPVLALTLDRRFDPVDVSLAAQRGVGLGGLGASSNVTDTVSLALRWSTPLGTDSSLTINAGANASRNRSVGAELIPANPEASAAGQALVALANGSDSLGATVGLALPLLAADGLRVDFDAMYGLTYNDPTAGAPEGAAAGLTAFTSHTLIATLRGSWGRGPLETAGDEDRTEQNAFANNPQSGSPLVSARLLNLRGQGLAEGSRGIAPGRAPASARAAPEERRRSQDAAQGVGRSESATAVEQASHRELDADAPKPPAPAAARPPRRAPVADGLELVPTPPTPPPPVAGEAPGAKTPDAGTTDAEAGEGQDAAPEGDAAKATEDDEDAKKRAPTKGKRKPR
jgi:hypothetical protein